MNNTRRRFLVWLPPVLGAFALGACVSKGDTNIDANSSRGGASDSDGGEESRGGMGSSADGSRGGSQSTAGDAASAGDESSGESESSEGGSVSNPAGGSAGAGDSGASGAAAGGAAGSAGVSVAGGGSGGESSAGCGELGQPCCSGECGDNLACLGDASCSCATKTAASYVIRADGAVLRFTVDSSGEGATVTVVGNADGQPLTGAIDVAQGVSNDQGGHACAALEDGTVWCWRETAEGNSLGQLGSGTADTNGPLFRATQVMQGAGTPLTDVRALSTGYAFATCAVTNQGSLFCWGDLSWIVNDGSSLPTAHATPVTADGLVELGGVVQTVLGGNATCAVREGGSSHELWCWGRNVSGELGQGDKTPRQYPVKVPGFSNPTKAAVSASTYLGNNTVCALDEGVVRCLGYNGNGNAGVNTTTTPVTIATTVKLATGTELTGLVDLAAGREEFCALHQNGSVWCWGKDYAIAATNVGASNVASLAGDTGDWEQNSPRYLTTDGVLHMGTKTQATPCGALN